MSMAKMILLILPLSLLWLASCATTPPGEGFNKRLQADVGKSVRDPGAIRNRYQSRKVKTRVLDNGHLEEEYFPGDKCTFYFEIDQDTNKIVAGRVDKYERYCDIP